MKLNPFHALRPPKEIVSSLASPPYDVINSDEARAMAEGNAKSFLRIIKPEIDLIENTDPYSDEVYEKARANFLFFQKQGWLIRDADKAVYVYRQETTGHSQTGLAGLCHVEDYDKGIIKKHENTIKKKEDDRTRHIQSLMANAGPVFLTYRGNKELNDWIDQQKTNNPLYDFTAEDGVRHTVWKICDMTFAQRSFDIIPCAYVADGHHRSASAARVARQCREGNSAHTGEEAYNWFLCVLFPSAQLNVLPYNRAIRNLNGLSNEAFLAKIRQVFTVHEEMREAPEKDGSICMYFQHTWFTLRWSEHSSDPVDDLDASVLQERLLEPILGIADPKNNPRITFVGGIHGAEKLKSLVDCGDYAVAFSMYPVAIEKMMSVADVGKNMPPKCTWFEPKLHSGLLIHSLLD